MRIPEKFSMNTRLYVQIQTKLNLYIAKYGCAQVAAYLDFLPLRLIKRDGKNLGAYIISMVSKEYCVSRFELFEDTSRHDIMEPRQMICVLCEKYLKVNRSDLSIMFHRSRHFAKRLIIDFYDKQKENHPLDKELLNRFSRLDALVASYVNFIPKSKRI